MVTAPIATSATRYSDGDGACSDRDIGYQPPQTVMETVQIWILTTSISYSKDALVDDQKPVFSVRL